MLPHVQYLICCIEAHQDGTPHVHAVIQFSKKVDIRNERHFDLNEFHPNVQSVKHMGKSINYVKKDGLYTEYGECKQAERDVTSRDIPQYRSEMTKLEWLTECLEQKVPYGYALAIWDLHNESTFTTLTEFDTKYKSRVSNSLLQLTEPREDHLQSYLIVGPSGCGKTTWTKLHCKKPALMVTHMDDLKTFKIGYHQSILFDDMKFTHLDPVLQIPIVDRYDNRSIHCRYSVAHIPAGIQKFFTCNVIPFNLEVPQIKRRINLINLF